MRSDADIAVFLDENWDWCLKRYLPDMTRLPPGVPAQLKRLGALAASADERCRAAIALAEEQHQAQKEAAEAQWEEKVSELTEKRKQLHREAEKKALDEADQLRAGLAQKEEELRRTFDAKAAKVLGSSVQDAQAYLDILHQRAAALQEEANCLEGGHKEALLVQAKALQAAHDKRQRQMDDVITTLRLTLDMNLRALQSARERREAASLRDGEVTCNHIEKTFAPRIEEAHSDHEKRLDELAATLARARQSAQLMKVSEFDSIRASWAKFVARERHVRTPSLRRGLTPHPHSQSAEVPFNAASVRFATA